MDNNQYLANPNAEAAIISAMMNNKESANTAMEFLSGDDFAIKEHRYMFEALVSVMNNNMVTDDINITHEAQLAGHSKELNQVVINTLRNYAPLENDVLSKVRIVRDCKIRRDLCDLANSVAQEARQETTVGSELVDKTEQSLLSIVRRKTNGITPAAFGEAVDDLIENAFSGGGITGLPSGFPDIDHITHGWQNGDLVLIAARPAMGKTALALNFASNTAFRSGKYVAFFSLEMSNKQVSNRILRAESDIDFGTLFGKQADYEYKTQTLQKISDVSNDLQKRGTLIVNDTGDITVSELRAQCRRLKAQGKLDMVVIDYLQLMGMSDKTQNRNLEIGVISRSLKIMARELEVPVIALSQLSRSVENRQVKKPMLSDLRDSGTLEQDADIIMFLYREDYYKDADDESKTGIAELIIAKHRNGATGSIALKFRPEVVKFESLPKGGYLAP